MIKSIHRALLERTQYAIHEDNKKLLNKNQKA